MSPKRLSVAMTTCNGARFLKEQLESVTNQTSPPDELVVSDDASADSTIGILSEFARSSRFPVKLLRNTTRLGFRENFMACALHCSGELIAFCDQDDIWAPGKLATQVQDFNDDHIMLSCHNADLIDSNGMRLAGHLDQFPTTCCLDVVSAGPSMFPRGFTQVVRKDLLKWEWLRQVSLDIGDPKEIMSHDAWMFFVALLHGSASYHAEPLAHHRQHGGNTSGAIPTQWQRLRWRLLSQPSNYERLAQVWANRRDMLKWLLENERGLEDATRIRVSKAYDLYARSAVAASRRVELHGRSSRFSRARKLTHSVAIGDFQRKNPWRFPPEGALKDTIAIVLNWREEDQVV